MRFPPVLPSLVLLVYLLGGIYLFIEIRGEQVDGLVLFSAVKGRVLDHGQPVVGVQIERRMFWNMEDEPRREYTSTDSEGRFRFPEMKGSTRFGLMHRHFHIPVVNQKLLMSGESPPTLMYLYGRNTYMALEETGYPEIEMTCDLKTKGVEYQTFLYLNCPVKTHPDRKNP